MQTGFWPDLSLFTLPLWLETVPLVSNRACLILFKTSVFVAFWGLTVCSCSLSPNGSIYPLLSTFEHRKHCDLCNHLHKAWT
jgi:hypothetical protein